jgi:hypothetical protein
MLPQRTDATYNDEQPWQQQQGESGLWYSRFSQYLALGPTRSIREVYRLEKGDKLSKTPGKNWAKASQDFRWQARAQAYDDHQRKLIFTHRNALDTERVKKLDELIENLYVRATELLGSTTPEDLPKILDTLLKALHLMAKQTGSYAPARIEHTGKDGKPIEVHSEAEQQMRVIFYVPKARPIEDNQAIITSISEETATENEPT